MLLPGPFCLHCVPCLPDMSPAPRRFLPIARCRGRNSPGCLTEDCRVYSTDGPWGAGEPGLDGICYTFRSQDAGLAHLAGGPLALEPMVLFLSKDCCHHVTQCLQGSWVLLCDNPFPGKTQHTCSPQIGNLQQTEVRISSESKLVNQCILLRLFTGAEMTQRQLHHQSPPQHG